MVYEYEKHLNSSTVHTNSTGSVNTEYSSRTGNVNEALSRALVGDGKKTYEEECEQHRKEVNEKFDVAYQMLKDGSYMDALITGLQAVIKMFNPPNNPFIITGDAPTPISWKDIKSLFGLLKSLRALPSIISKLKSCKSLSQFKQILTDLAGELKLIKPKAKSGKVSGSKAGGAKPGAQKTHAQLVKEYSKGKNLVDMTDAELTAYYKKLVPGINEKELKCLIDQVQRLQKGQPRWLNTEEERELLSSIEEKIIKNERANGVKRLDDNGWRLYDESAHETANIPFKEKQLSDFQKVQLNKWYYRGDTEGIKSIFEELGTVLDHDVYLYRKVSIKAEMMNMDKSQCAFLNSIKEGGVINNGSNYTSTASNINHTQGGSCYHGQSYVLKIKVPKGTKVLDMRHYKQRVDEFVLPPCSYKVNKIDYTTGVVDCDFIPN